MKRTAGALVLLAALGGCMSVDQGTRQQVAGCGSCGAWSSGPPRVPGIQGPWGEPVAMIAPYSASPPGAEAARAMMARSVPMDLLQAGGLNGAGPSSGIVQAGGPAAASPGGISPSGVPFQPIVPVGCYPPGAVAGVGALTKPSTGGATERTEVRFVGPEKMKVSWCGTTTQGQPAMGYLVVPGRYNFVQGAVYRLRLSDIPSLPGVDLYPTLEVVPANARTAAFLAHSAVPVAFTNEDFEQVQAGNYLVKVIYLPNPPFQDLAAVAGPDEIVSTRLEPGADPIAEAHRRGNILLVIRLGNIDLGLTNSPGMNAPSPYGPTCGMAPGMSAPGLLPGMPMPPMMGGQQMASVPLVPNAPPMGSSPAQPVYTTLVPGPGGPSTAAMDQTIPLSQLPDASMSQQPNGAASSGQPTVITTSETMPAPKHHWWWPWGGADK